MYNVEYDYDTLMSNGEQGNSETLPVLSRFPPIYYPSFIFLLHQLVYASVGASLGDGQM
jgi:hypothetical protein